MTVTGSTTKTYRTWVSLESGTYFEDIERIGLSATEFFHVYPSAYWSSSHNPPYYVAYLNNIPTMAVSTSCGTGYQCYYYDSQYPVDDQPDYYGSYALGQYSQSGFTLPGGDSVTLLWFLSSDIVSAGTSGDNALTFTPDIRCNEYTLDASDNCICDWTGIPPASAGEVEDIINSTI